MICNKTHRYDARFEYFKEVLPQNKTHEQQEYEDEDTTYEYDHADENKPPVKHLNK